MDSPEGMFVDNRVVQHVHTRLEVHSNGHHRLFVEGLSGTIVEVFDGPTRDDVEHQLRHAGYQRIPPSMADDLDLFRLDAPRPYRPRPRR